MLHFGGESPKTRAPEGEVHSCISFFLHFTTITQVLTRLTCLHFRSFSKDFSRHPPVPTLGGLWILVFGVFILNLRATGSGVFDVFLPLSGFCILLRHMRSYSKAFCLWYLRGHLCLLLFSATHAFHLRFVDGL